jgi:uncharacterized DUF497 family protein
MRPAPLALRLIEVYTLYARFEWDKAKARRNLQEHGVSFSEAALAWDDPNFMEGDDPAHSRHEMRHWILGQSPKRRLLLVIFTKRHADTIRIITAWKANREEQELYEDEKRRD